MADRSPIDRSTDVHNDRTDQSSPARARPDDAPGSAGLAAVAAGVDPRRLRSVGVLTPQEVAACRRGGVALAYDPRQVGWVPAACRDDLDAPDFDEPAPVAASAEDAMRDAERLFEQRVAPLLQEAGRPDADRVALGAALFAVPEQVARAVRGRRGVPDARVGELLSELQRRAARLIARHVDTDADRAALRERCRDASARVVLRAWQPADAARFRELLDDSEVWRHLPEPYPDPLTEEMAAALIELAGDTARHAVCAIEQGGEPVGQIRIEHRGPHVDPAGGDAEISYWLGRAYWRSGIMRDVLPLFTLRCFERWPLESVFARALEANRGSTRVLERSGYRFEGRLRAELAGEPQMRTYRVWRSDYLGLGAAPTRRVRADVPLGTGGATASG